MESKYYYHKCGNQFRIKPKVNLDLREGLPAGTYSVAFDDRSREYYLETVEDFKLKGKIYGKVSKHSNRIMRTFLDRNTSTGVLLAGDKGSGKTLLAQYISIAAANEGEIPTIIINKPWFGDQFNSFIQSIEQPSIILFDEFEKVYQRNGPENYQEKILTLFDGVYASKKLFLLTCNDKTSIDNHLMNRPGRIYYMIEFKGLENDFITEYCEDNLLQKDCIPSVCAVSALFKSFNFDMLKAIVEDMNRYDESPSEVLKYLNIRPDNEGRSNFTVKLIVDGKKDREAAKNWYGNPLTQVIGIYCNRVDENGNKKEGKNYYFSASHLQKLDSTTKVYQFKNEAGVKLILTPVPSLKFSFDTVASPDWCRDSENYAKNEIDSDSEEEKYESMMYYG